MDDADRLRDNSVRQILHRAEHRTADLNAIIAILSDHVGGLSFTTRMGVAVEIDEWARQRYWSNHPTVVNHLDEISTDAGVVTLREVPVRAKSRETLAKIRAAAVELYSDPEIGRDRITTTMVAERAGVSVGQIYRFWSNRVAMLDDIAPYRPQF
jgi:hypothetical protein